MRICIVNAVYPPEPVVSAQIGQDLARVLVARGHEVTVLCPRPSRPSVAAYPGFEAVGRQASAGDGIAVVRLPSYLAPKARVLARAWESLSFGREACRYLGNQAQDFDIIYANTWPLFSQWLVARFAHRRRIPLVLHIQDIYPESLLEKLPRFAGGLLAAPLLGMDRANVHRAAVTVVISEYMRQVYLERRKMPANRIRLCRNWQDDSLFAEKQDRAAACRRYGVAAGKFTFLFLGNIGAVAGVDFLLRTFHAARVPNAQLLIIGGGSAREDCVRLATELAMKNVQFIADPDVRNVPQLQAMGDVLLLPLRKRTSLSSFPSKLAAYLFSGKPILATVDAASDTARCIRDAQCGWVGEPEDAGWLAGMMREIAALSGIELDELGRRGRHYGLANCSKVAGANRLADIICEARRASGETRELAENRPIVSPS